MRERKQFLKFVVSWELLLVDIIGWDILLNEYTSYHFYTSMPPFYIAKFWCLLNGYLQ